MSIGDREIYQSSCSRLFCSLEKRTSKVPTFIDITFYNEGVLYRRLRKMRKMASQKYVVAYEIVQNRAIMYHKVPSTPKRLVGGVDFV